MSKLFHFSNDLSNRVSIDKQSVDFYATDRDFCKVGRIRCKHKRGICAHVRVIGLHSSKWQTIRQNGVIIVFVRESLPRERCLFRNERTITVNYYLVECKVFIEGTGEKSFAFYFVDFNGNNSYSMQKAMRQFSLLSLPANFNRKRYLRYIVRYTFVQYKIENINFAVQNFFD